MKTRDPEFYIGWAPTPPRLARFLRLTVLGICVLVAGVAAVLVSGLRPEAEARFEYGKPRAWQGRVALDPAPLLWTRDGQAFLLVAPGKHGAEDLLAALDGAEVALRGALIERPGPLGAQRMLEVEPGSLVAQTSAASAAVPAAHSLGPVRWRGEIADGKCYLGVMVPGEGKTHRDCAARCLSGGTPPLFSVGRGGAAVLLAARDGRPLGPRLAPYAGEPVWVSGELMSLGDLLVLEIDPAELARADE